MADFLVALADFDRRRGWEPLGHASLFAFLHVELRLSNSASFWRMSAARLLQRFPDLIEPLGDGRLCLSTTAELAKVLTEENRAEVASRFFGLSAREAREVVAELLPRDVPPLRAVVTSVDRGATRPGPTLALAPPHSATLSESSRADTDSGSLLTSEVTPTHPARDAARRDDVEPLTAELRRLHITVDRQFLKLLDAARDGLSHSIPGASTEQVLKAATMPWRRGRYSWNASSPDTRDLVLAKDGLRRASAARFEVRASATGPPPEHPSRPRLP